ncbi:MAG TPA: hypothetical protein VGG44_04770 [Tepidisphaeraceae bacterium]
MRKGLGLRGLEGVNRRGEEIWARRMAQASDLSRVAQAMRGFSELQKGERPDMAASRAAGQFRRFWCFN